MSEMMNGAPAPQVTTPPGAQPEPAPEIPAEQANAESTEQPAQPTKTYSEKEFQARLGRKSRELEKRLRAEIERDFYKSQIEQGGPRQPQAEKTAKAEPRVEDFQNDPAGFIRAMARWEAQQLREQERQQESRESETQSKQQSQLERARFAREKIFEPGQAKYADFADVVMDEDVPITDVMLMAAGRLKSGVDVLYHLGKNPAEAMRIARLPDIEQAWEVKDLGSKLTAPPKTTGAPPPIVPNNPGATAAKSPADMSSKERIEAYLNRKKR